MRKATLIGILLFTSLVTFSQRKTTKPKVKPKPAAKWEQYSPCGVYYKDVVDLMDDSERGWRFIGESKSERVWYDSDKQRCTDNGILKSWIKRVHKEADLKYALVLYELKCKSDELRIKSVVEYDKEGRVLESNQYPDAPWGDVIPDSIGESMMKTICRRP